MKTILFSLALSAATLIANPTTVQAQSADIAAIKALVEKEITTWNNRDATDMADCWANVPEAGQLVSLQDGKSTVISNHNTKMDMPGSIKTMLAGMGPITTIAISLNNDSGGTVFGVYGLNKLPQMGQYEVRVSATSVETSKPSTTHFFCDYVITGKTKKN